MLVSLEKLLLAIGNWLLAYWFMKRNPAKW